MYPNERNFFVFQGETGSFGPSGPAGARGPPVSFILSLLDA